MHARSALVVGFVLGSLGCSSGSGSAAGAGEPGSETGGSGSVIPGAGGATNEPKPSKVVRALAGGSTACAELDDGSYWCWGDNGNGELGPALSVKSAATPSRLNVPGLARLELASGRACGVMATGDVACWGKLAGADPNTGSLSTTSSKPQSIDLPKAESTALSPNTACAITSEGDAHCWGENDRGQLGFGPTDPVFEPVKLTTVNMAPFALESAVLGPAHGCGLKKGYLPWVLCWGDNDFGQLGYPDTTVPDPSPRTVYAFETGEPLRAKQVAVGWFHTCALLEDTTVSCWGDNGNAQLGNGGLDSNPYAHQVANLASVVEIVAAGTTTCVRTFSGSISCWGENTQGVILGESLTEFDQPVELDLPLGATSLALGDDFACAGYPNEVICWGKNEFGQLGDGTYAPRTGARPVAGLPLP